MIGQYILNESGDPVPCEDLLKWGSWMEKAERHVADDTLEGGVRISTVFLGLDHGFGGGGAPVLFETMIFGGAHDDYCERYTSKQDAIEGHKKALALARNGIAA